MSATENKAIFLSYASQDAAAAKRICDALRAAGVEVWFDQSELVGGDAWDQKIRRHIRECALLIPVISKTTQARREAYFRLEWKLADERTHLMAKGTPFLLPVTIDETTDRDAVVPDSFLTVQWTKAPGGEVPPAFLARVQRLLSGESSAWGPRQAAPADDDLPIRKKHRGWWGAAVAGVVGGGALVLWQPWQAKQTVGAAVPPPAVITAPVSEARKLAQRALELATDPNYTRESVWLADELCTRAVALDAADAEVWAKAAFVGQTLWQHVYDSSDARRQKCRAQADRAVQLAPASVMGRLTVARNFAIAGDNAEAARLLRELATEAPQEAFVWQSFSWISRRLDREADVAEAIQRLRALDHRPALLTALFLEARDLRNRLRYPEAEAILDELLVDPPVRHAYYEKFNLLTRGWHELAEAEPFIAKIPMRFQQEPAFGSGIAQYWLRRGEPDKALSALARVPLDYFEEYAAREPKAYLAGWAHTLAGRPTAAQAEWRNALALVEERVKENPRNLHLLSLKAQLLGYTGKPDAARETWKLRVELTDADSPLSAENLAHFHLAVQENEEAITALGLRWATTAPNTRTVLMWGLRYAPWFAPIRADPRIQKLVTEHQAFLDGLKRKSGVTAAASAMATGTTVSSAALAKEDKSVAVLAFANLSDDKANEYFSDGISEELLNVLAKVPGLKVSARTSAFYFKGKDTPIPEIARQLGVAYVVEGSVRKQGDKVRITAQLIKAADGFHVWSDTFTRDLKDIFAVQDEIAGLIAKNLELKLGQAVERAVAEAFNPEAFRLYLQGREAWNRRDAAGFQQAELLFHRALELEPRFARAHAALADVWMLGAAEPVGGYAQRQSPLMMRVIAKAEQAVAMDEKSAEAHASLGHALGYAWRFADSQRELRRAIELNPNYASAHQWLGRALLEQGQLDEAIASLHRAAELDPLSHRILDNYADALECAGRLEEAWALLGRAAALQPSGVQIRCKQALLLQRLGRRDEALAAARALAADEAAGEPDYRHSTAVAVLSAYGETTEAEASLRRIAPESEDYPIALLYAGRIREFIAHLDYTSINWIQNFLFNPGFAAIRAEPALRAWAGKVGMAEALARAESWTAAHQARNPETKK